MIKSIKKMKTKIKQVDQVPDLHLGNMAAVLH